MKNNIDNILKTGEPLASIGVNNWALTSTQSIAAISKLMLNGVAIYGGDVLIKKNGKYQHLCDNWYSERKDTESWLAFVIRSAKESRLEIEYYNGVYENPFFTLVVQAEGSIL